MDKEKEEIEEIKISQHPWRRYFAKTVDMGILYSLVFVPYTLISKNIKFSYFESILRTLIIMFLLFLIESIMLSIFGTTIGKWLLNIRIQQIDKSKIEFKKAVIRSFGVYGRGLAFGLPIVSIFTELHAYDELQDYGITSWDKKAGTKVVFGKINKLKILIAIILFISPVLIVTLAPIKDESLIKDEQLIKTKNVMERQVEEALFTDNYKVGEEDQYIEELIKVIMSSPMESSNPGDYIKAHKEEYNIIIDMDETAIKYMFKEFEKGGQRGLKGRIMESLCRRILAGEDIKLEAETGQEWFDEIKNHTLYIYELNSMEFMKENYKYLYLLIDGNKDYKTNHELVSYSDGIVEIDGAIIGYDGNLQEELVGITQKQADQMMVNAVKFYKSAFLKDYETMKTYVSEDLVKRIDDYENNPSDLSNLYVVMNFENYSDQPSPFMISSPVKEGDNYIIYLEIFSKNNPGGQLIVSFNHDSLDKPIIINVSQEL